MRGVNEPDVLEDELLELEDILLFCPEELDGVLELLKITDGTVLSSAVQLLKLAATSTKKNNCIEYMAPLQTGLFGAYFTEKVYILDDGLHGSR
jgi:hypothetical protein